MYANFSGQSELLWSGARKTNINKLEWSQGLILVEALSSQ